MEVKYKLRQIVLKGPRDERSKQRSNEQLCLDKGVRNVGHRASRLHTKDEADEGETGAEILRTTMSPDGRKRETGSVHT
jgi:hypothetical protein